MSKKHAPVVLVCQRLWLCLLAVILTGKSALAETPPAGHASDQPWKFAFFCDGRSDKANDPGASNGVRWASVKALAAHAAGQQVDLVIFPGDLANGATNFGSLAAQWSEWQRDMAPLYDAGIPVYVARGNHELRQPDSIETWKKLFSYLPQNGPEGQKGLTYKVERKNACFIAIDQFVGQTTNHGEAQDKTAAVTGMVSPWVIDQIKRTPKRWVIVFGHESAFFGHHTDCLASDLEGRDQLWNALGARGGVYLSGHDHMYIRHWAADKDNHPVLEVVAGCAGAPLYPYDHATLNHQPPTDLFVNAAKPTSNSHAYPACFGYVLITVYPDRLEGEWWALVNYDTTRLATALPPDDPKLERLDSFTWPPGGSATSPP